MLNTIIIIFSIIIFLLLLVQYFQGTDNNNYSVTEGMAPNKDTESSIQRNVCPKGCIIPTKLSSKCHDKIYKDDVGRCYKLCPYECTDPMAPCAFDGCCGNCGKVRIYVDCDTGKEINDGPDLNDPSQEANYSASSINTGKTNNSQSDIQGSILDRDEESDDEIDDSENNSNNIRDINKDNSSPSIIQYHNHYYNMIPDSALIHTAQRTSINNKDDPQKGTPNPYRQGGDISNTLDNQTATMEYGLSLKKDASSIMNYGSYGAPLNDKGRETNFKKTITGIYDDHTTPGVNSLYSLKL